MSILQTFFIIILIINNIMSKNGTSRAPSPTNIPIMFVQMILRGRNTSLPNGGGGTACRVGRGLKESYIFIAPPRLANYNLKKINMLQVARHPSQRRGNIVRTNQERQGSLPTFFLKESGVKVKKSA